LASTLRKINRIAFIPSFGEGQANIGERRVRVLSASTATRMERKDYEENVSS
jgi:hypothetical protein